MGTLGSLVVQLDLDGAQFVRNTANARAAIERFGNSTAATGQPLEIVRSQTERFGATVDRSTRGVTRLATRLADISGVIAPELGGFISVLERNLGSLEMTVGRTTSAFGLLGAAGAAVGAFLIARQIGEAMSEWIGLGASVETYKKRLEETVAAQNKFADAHNTLRAAVRDNDQAMRAALSATLVIALNASDRQIAALEEERKARIANIDQVEAEALAKVRAAQAALIATAPEQAGDPEVQQQFEQQRLAIHARFAAERERIDAEADDKIRQQREQDFDRERGMERERASMIISRRAAEFAATTEALTASGRFIEAAQTRGAAEIAAIQDAAAQQRAAWEDMLRKRQIDSTAFDGLLVLQAAVTGAATAKAYFTRWQNVRQSILTGPGAVLPGLDMNALMGQLATARTAFEATFKVGQSVPATGPALGPGAAFGPPGVGGPMVLQGDIEASRQATQAWWEATDAANAYEQARLQIEKEANRPRLREGFAAIAQIGDQLTGTIETLGTLKNRLSASDVFIEQARTAQYFRDRLEEVRTTFRNTPAVVEEASRALANIDTAVFQGRTDLLIQSWEGLRDLLAKPLPIPVIDIDYSKIAAASRALAALRDDLRQSPIAAITASPAAMMQSAGLSLDTTAADKALAALRAEAAKPLMVALTADADTTAADKALAALRAEAAKPLTLIASADTTAIERALAALQRAWQGVELPAITAPIPTLDVDAFKAALAALQRAWQGVELPATEASASIDIDSFRGQLMALRAAWDSLQLAAVTAPTPMVETEAFTTAVAALQRIWQGLHFEQAAAPTPTVDATSFEISIGALKRAWQDLRFDEIAVPTPRVDTAAFGQQVAALTDSWDVLLRALSDGTPRAAATAQQALANLVSVVSQLSSWARQAQIDLKNLAGEEA
ncbi:MAG TPA: hypothetical protein VGV13_00935 [Methylomirabilota bacterium]|nr:hypothetical protein [Methylomirabilota bacterium]